MATSDPPAGAASAGPPSDHDQPRFARASSGLVRELSIVDTALYGILATGALYGVLYLFPTPQAVSTGINVPVMLILGFLFSLLVYYVYAQLGSAMPRAGGDYLYESRALGPSVGFVVPWACQVLFWLAFPSLGAYGVSTLGLVPIADTLGLHGVSSWLLTKDGIFVVAAIFVIVGYLLTVFGLSLYRKIQRYVLIPVLAISVVTIYILLLANLGTDFDRQVQRVPRRGRDHCGRRPQGGREGGLRRRLVQPRQHPDLDLGLRGRAALHHVRRPGPDGRGEAGGQRPQAVRSVRDPGIHRGDRVDGDPLRDAQQHRREQVHGRVRDRLHQRRHSAGLLPQLQRLSLDADQQRPGDHPDLAGLRGLELRDRLRGLHELVPGDDGHGARRRPAEVLLGCVAPLPHPGEGDHAVVHDRHGRGRALRLPARAHS